MKKQNVLVVCMAVALIALVAVLAFVLPQNRTLPENAPTVQLNDAPAATDVPAAQPTAESAATATDLPKVEAYLLLTVQGAVYEPLPLAGEGSFTIKQEDGATNTVHVTPTSVYMEHSSCENQDCVEQGTVSLDNIDDRVLYNMIICLPNQVTLELHTEETLKKVFGVAE